MDASCLHPGDEPSDREVIRQAPLHRVRLLCLALAIAAIALEALAVGTSLAGDHGVHEVTALVALGALCLWWLQPFHGERMPAWRDPIEFLLVGLVGVASGADATAGLLLVGVIFRSLFTGPVRTAVGVLAYEGAYLAAIVLGPPDAELDVITGLRALPLFAVAGGLAHAFARWLRRYDTLRQEVAAASADRRLATIVRHSNDIITLLDTDHRVRYQTPSIAQLGYAPGELTGTVLADLLHPDDQGPIRASFDAALANPDGSAHAVECRWRTRDGQYRLMQTVRSDLLGDPDVRGIVLTSRDITAHRALEEELKHRAFHDALTGLANRGRLEQRLVDERARAGGPLLSPALVLLDLDDFKAVNDSLGHAAGDRLLVAVGERLRAHAAPPDLVARLGGDEFALLLHCRSGDALTHRVRTLLAALAEPFRVQGRDLRISASAGICVPGPGDGPDEVLRNADLALYRAKEHGKGRHASFEPSMHDAAVEALELEADLRRALEADELELHYQPLFNAGRDVVGTEALLRWRHPERGLLLPGAFLDTAERSRLIVPVGRWVLREACRQGARWAQEHPRLGRIGIGVNVSAEQLREPSLVDDVRDALARAELDPERLVLEITETVLMQDLQRAATTLAQVKALGVQLALDDFGTGYSSLAYLQRLPLDFLKVPRPFVATLGSDPRALDLIQGIVSLGSSLGLRVTAEGVETEEQRRIVHDVGCSIAQGFLLSRPVPASGIDALMAARAGAPV